MPSKDAPSNQNVLSSSSSLSDKMEIDDQENQIIKVQNAKANNNKRKKNHKQHKKGDLLSAFQDDHNNIPAPIKLKKKKRKLSDISDNDVSPPMKKKKLNDASPIKMST